LIVQQRAAGRTVQSIAAEHGLSPARVSQVCRDHRLEVRVAELEAKVREYEEILDYHPAH
jgi:DNA-binding LacI/PurR family transcriptional regulator